MATRSQKRKRYNDNKRSESRRLRFDALFNTETVNKELRSKPHPSISELNYYDYCEWMYKNGYDKGTLSALKEARRSDPTPLNRKGLAAAWHESEMIYPGPERDGFPYHDYTDEQLREVYL